MKQLALLDEHGGPFKPAREGDPPQTFTFFNPKLANDDCHLAGETPFFEQFKFSFTDIGTKSQVRTWPRNGITWREDLKQLTFHPSRADQAGLHKILLTVSCPNIKEPRMAVEIKYSILDAPNDKAQMQEKVEPDRPHRLMSVGEGQCLNSPGMLNLINTNVLAEQNSFYASNSLIANTACDGDVIAINTGNPPASYSIVSTKQSVSSIDGTPSVPQYWKATFSQEVSIKTILIINRDNTNYWTRIQNYIASVGNNSDVTQNPICVALGTVTDGGWYMCLESLLGRVLGIFTTSSKVNFFELLAFSQEAIQLNARVTFSITGTAIDKHPGSNVLQNIVVTLTTDLARQKCVNIVQPAGNLARFSIKFEAQVPIKGIVMIPGYQMSLSSWPAQQTNVAVYSQSVSGTQHQCGVIDNYYTHYGELQCSNMLANEIILVQQNSTHDLRFCGFAALADCDCASSSFSPSNFTTAPALSLASATTITAKSTDSSHSITLNPHIPDTISTVCGHADGVSKCGPRVLKFKDKTTGQSITFPYKGFHFDASTSVLTLNPAQADAKCVLTATIQLVKHPGVTYSQDITAIVQGGVPDVPMFSIPTLNLNATINQQADLQLPHLDPQYSYAVTSKQAFLASVRGTQLQVLSTNEADVGTQYLDLEAVSTANTVSFKVKVTFKSALNATTTQRNPVQDDAESNSTQVSSQTNDSLEDDLLQTQLNQVTCDDEGVCVDTSNSRFSCQYDQEVGQMVCGIDLHLQKTRTNSTSVKTIKPPEMVMSKVSSKGVLTLAFSEPMDFTSLINTTFGVSNTNSSRKLAKKGGGGGGGKGYDRSGAGKLYQTNGTDAIDVNLYKYLLSDDYLRISLQPDQEQNATKKQFEWFAMDVTNTTIEIQILFENPTYISTDRSMPDHLVIKLLPAIVSLKSLSSNMTIVSPLRTEKRILPPQLILGPVAKGVEKAAGNLKDVGQGVVIGNFILHAVLNGIITAMYTMIHALQMTMVISLLVVAMPANVSMVMTQVNTMASFDYLPSDRIFEYCFKFSTALMPLVAFQEFGDLSVRLILFLGSFVIVAFAICLQSVLFLATWPFSKKYKLVTRFHNMMRKNYYWRGIIRLILESYFDLCLGIMFSWQQPRFDTPSDIFDFVLTFFFTVVVLGGPITGHYLLRKYAKELYGDHFQNHYGSITEGLKTTGVLGSEATHAFIVWYFVRRFLTALALVFLGSSSPVFQIAIVMYLSLLDVLMNFHLNAYENFMNGAVAKFNDMIVFVLSYFPFCYAGLIHDSELMYQVGWCQVGLVGIMFTANLTVVIITTISEAINECRRGAVERHNYNMLLQHNYEMEISQKSGWQTLSELATVDWVCYNSTPARLNVQIQPFVYRFIHQRAENLVDQIDEFRYYEDLKQNNVEENIFVRNEPTENVPAIQDQTQIGQQPIDQPKEQVREETRGHETVDNQPNKNKVLPVQQIKPPIRFFIGNRSRMFQVVQAVDGNTQLNQLKAFYFDTIIKSLTASQDPIVANLPRDLAAAQLSQKLPDDICQMPQKEIEDRVRSLIRAESTPASTVKSTHDQESQTQVEKAFDAILARLVTQEDPMVANEKSNLDARDFARLLPHGIALMSLKDQEGEVRNLISLVSQSETVVVQEQPRPYDLDTLMKSVSHELEARQRQVDSIIKEVFGHD